MIKQCLVCNKDFTTYANLIKIGKGKFCSRECSNFTENTKVTKKCGICSTEFQTTLDRIKDGRGKFCSRKCYTQDWNKRIPGWNKGQSATWAIGNQHRKGIPNLNPNVKSGKDNPNWKGGNTVGVDNRQKYFLKKRHERRAKMVSVGGKYSNSEWETLKRKYNYMCLSCKQQEPKVKLTIDHVIPIAKGGNNSIENIQPLCKSCNCKKHTQETDYRFVD